MKCRDVSVSILLCLSAFTLLCSARGYGGDIPFCGMVKVPPQRANPGLEAMAFLPAADEGTEPTIIDVMFLYTPEALIGAGDVEKLRTRIRQSIEEANYTYTNSQINISINLVHIGEIGYVESGDIRDDLAALASGVGAFAALNTLRNDYKADI